MESSNGISQGQDINSEPRAVEHVEGTSPPTQVHTERTFKQTEVNDIVKRAKYGAVEDYKRLHTEQPQYASQKNEHISQQQTHQSGSQTHHENDIRRMAAEEAQRLRDQWIRDEQSKVDQANAHRTVQNFWQKVSQGKDKYQDFDKVTGDINLKAFPNVVQLLGDFVDNSHDVLYELGKDRTKMANLESLAYLSPHDAIIQAQRLSQSIKDNDSASKMKLPKEPLSQMRPTNTGADTGSTMGVSDYRRKYRV